MKKIKSLLGIALLSTFLVGNVFAGGTTAGYGIFSFFDSVIEAIVSLARSADDGCPTRQCQTCKPNERDENGNCKPPRE